MKKYFDLLDNCLDPKLENKATALGYAAMVMSRCKRSSNFQIRTLYYWLVPAIEHGQIIFLFDRTSQPIGFVLWAHLAPDSEQRFLHDANFFLHPSEWNEGGRTWIIDFCFPEGAVKEALVVLKKRLGEFGITHVAWARRGADYSIKRTGNFKL